MNDVTRIETPAPTSLMEVIARAATDSAVDVDKMERLLQMQERILARQSESDFNGALADCQVETGRVAANRENKQTQSRYATYDKLDKVLRPIYTKHGLSLSFGTTDCPIPEHIRVICHVSHRGGHSRMYQIDVPADGKGAKGGDVMTKTHAAGAAMSYGMRYLLKAIFNVAIGEEDRDGNQSEPTLSEKQIADIDALLSEYGGNKAQFLKFCKVDSLGDIPAKNFDAACREIRARKAK